MRSIPFSTVMVQALRRVERPKTQTRRIIKPQPPSTKRGRPWVSIEDLLAGCPYGAPGDVLLVKESWCVHRHYDGVKPSELPAAAWKSIHWMADGAKPTTHGRTRIGRFLPNDRVRDRIEIVALRAERVKSISEADAIAEGIRSFTKDGKLLKFWPCDPCDGPLKCAWQDLPRTAVEAFFELFYGINARAERDANPWVWVITFRRLPPVPSAA